MKTLLRIDSSIRINDSVSREIGDHFIDHWKKKYPTGKIITRDLTVSPIPHLTEQTVQAFFNGDISGEVLALSDELIDEIMLCDELLITCPMYNFHIPSSLKAYFDHVVRVNKTFQHNQGEYIGLVRNKRCYIITTMGGKKTGTPREEAVENYLRNILAFVGIHDIVIHGVDGTAVPGNLTHLLEESKHKITNSTFIL